MNRQAESPGIFSLSQLRWGATYFAVVFLFGFLFGMIRVGLLEPRLGIRYAELSETPFMLVAVVMTSRWIVRRTNSRFSGFSYIGTGPVALLLLLLAEVAVVFLVRGMSVSEYIGNRDVVSGNVYLLMLGLFAAMPWIVSRFGHELRR